MLRELARRQVADTVEVEVDAGRVKERVLMACAAELEPARLIRRGGRLAQRLNAELDVVHVETRRLGRREAQLLDALRVITEALGGRFRMIPRRGKVGRTLVAYVRAARVTPVVRGERRRSRWAAFLRGSIVNSVLRETEGVDVITCR